MVLSTLQSAPMTIVGVSITRVYGLAAEPTNAVMHRSRWSMKFCAVIDRGAAARLSTVMSKRSSGSSGRIWKNRRGETYSFGMATGGPNVKRRRGLSVGSVKPWKNRSPNQSSGRPTWPLNRTVESSSTRQTFCCETPMMSLVASSSEANVTFAWTKNEAPSTCHAQNRFPTIPSSR